MTFDQSICPKNKSGASSKKPISYPQHSIHIHIKKPVGQDTLYVQEISRDCQRQSPKLLIRSASLAFPGNGLAAATATKSFGLAVAWKDGANSIFLKLGDLGALVFLQYVFCLVFLSCFLSLKHPTSSFLCLINSFGMEVLWK